MQLVGLNAGPCADRASDIHELFLSARNLFVSISNNTSYQSKKLVSMPNFQPTYLPQ
jgi:hypothetical protein